MVTVRVMLISITSAAERMQSVIEPQPVLDVKNE